MAAPRWVFERGRNLASGATAGNRGADGRGVLNPQRSPADQTGEEPRRRGVRAV